MQGWPSPPPPSPGLQSPVPGWRVFYLCPKCLPTGAWARPRSASWQSVVRVGGCKDQCVSWSCVFKCKDVPSWRGFSSGSPNPGDAKGMCPAGARQWVSSAEVMVVVVVVLPELWGGWTAGWSELDGPIPSPAWQGGLWLWKFRRWGWSGFTLYPHSLQMVGEGFPAAPHLGSGKAWGIKLGEGCQNPMVSCTPSTKQ